MTKQAFASGVSKAIPIAGAVISGGLTLATFVPMANRLKRHLTELDLARPTLAEGEPGAWPSRVGRK